MEIPLLVHTHTIFDNCSSSLSIANKKKLLVLLNMGIYSMKKYFINNVYVYTLHIIMHASQEYRNTLEISA